MPNHPYPTKSALALATAIAALAAYRLLDPTKGLSPAIFPEAAHLTLMRRNPTHIQSQQATKPLNGIQQPQVAMHSPNIPTPTPNPCSWNDVSYGRGGPTSLGFELTQHPSISPYFIDNCGTLDPVFADLQTLEAHREPRKVVTILHYGDSPTTADLITGDVRDLLQQRFGDAGRGFLLTAKPWAWYQHRGVEISDKNWQTSTAVGKGRPEVYGIGGASFQGDSTASTHITLKDPTQTTLEIAFETQPNAGALTISANGTPITTLPLDAPVTGPFWKTIPLPPQTRTIDLHPTGPVRLFGETLLTGRPGVLYDSLGLNGASTSVLSNGFNAEAWQIELRHTQPALVIINYGTNESSYGPYVDKLYEGTLRTAILRIRAALPGVPILVMSPMDRGRRAGVDQIETYDTIPRIIAIQRRVAAELNCAFFDTFDAMGGDGTMARWYNGHPRLVAGDLIHPTPQGAAIVAHLFVHDLGLAYDRYLGHQPTQPRPVTMEKGIGPPPPYEPLFGPTPPKPSQHLLFSQPPATKPLEPSTKPKPSAAGEPIPATPPTPASESSTPQPQPPPSL